MSLAAGVGTMTSLVRGSNARNLMHTEEYELRHRVAYVRYSGAAADGDEDWWRQKEAWIEPRPMSQQSKKKMASDGQQSVVLGGKNPVMCAELQVKGKHKWAPHTVVLTGVSIGMYDAGVKPESLQGLADGKDPAQKPLQACSIELLDDYKGGKHKHAWTITFPDKGKETIKPMFLQATDDVQRSKWCSAIEICTERAEIGIQQRHDALEQERFMAAHNADSEKNKFDDLLKALRVEAHRDALAAGSIRRVVDVACKLSTKQDCVKIGLDAAQSQRVLKWIPSYQDQVAREFGQVLEDCALPPQKEDVLWQSCPTVRARSDFIRLDRIRQAAEVTAEVTGRGRNSAAFYARELFLMVGAGPRGSKTIDVVEQAELLRALDGMMRTCSRTWLSTFASMEGIALLFSLPLGWNNQYSDALCSLWISIVRSMMKMKTGFDLFCSTEVRHVRAVAARSFPCRAPRVHETV